MKESAVVIVSTILEVVATSLQLSNCTLELWSFGALKSCGAGCALDTLVTRASTCMLRRDKETIDALGEYQASKTTLLTD